MAKNDAVPLSSTGKPRLFYGYIILATCFLSMLVIHGIVNSYGVFFNPLLNQFHTSREAVSAISTISFFIMGAAAIPMGILSDRLGPRIVMSVGAAIFGSGFILLSRVNSLWQMYLVFIIIGLGSGPSDVVPLSVIVRWFAKRRGMMSGITKVGTGVGMTVVPILASILIIRYDWRTAFLILGVVVLVTVIPLAQLFKRDPREIGQLPDGEQKQQANDRLPAEVGLSFRQAIRTRQMWLVCGLYATLLVCSQSIIIHIVPYAVDLHIPQTVAAGLVATIGGASIVGRLVMGFSSDRMGRKRGFLVCFLVLVTALSWLQGAKELWMLYAFATVYGFAHGGFFAQISPLVAWLFGTRSQGTLLGVVIFAGNFFGSVSPMITGKIFDVTGSYHWAFIFLLLSAIIGLIFIILLKPIIREVKHETG